MTAATAACAQSSNPVAPHGVVEARAADGALMGFERVAELARKSAGELADAAKDFGQDDGITVLTLKFAGSEGMLA